MPRLLSALLAAVLLTLTLAAATAAHAEDYKVFHPRQNVVAKQLSPGKMRFTNRTRWCMALTVTNRLRGGTLASSTHRLWYTHDTQGLWGRGKVVKVRVYRPGC